jgi:uncharacterized protein YcbK (DUF882 family)
MENKDQKTNNQQDQPGSNESNKPAKKNKNKRNFRNRNKKRTDNSENPDKKNNNQSRDRRRHKNNNDQKNKPRFSSSQITENYTKEDFSCKCGECNNRFKMSLFLIGVLESLKLKIDNKPEIIKGYICEEAASKMAITKKSYHVLGKAIDFKVPKEKLAEAFRYLEAVPEVTGLGLDPENGFIHIDTRDKEPQKWIYQKGEQKELVAELREKYALGDDVQSERKDFITA